MELMSKGITTFAEQMDELVWIITILAAFWFAVAFLAMLIFTFGSMRKEGKKAAYLKGDGKQVWAILIPVILVVMCDAYIDVKTTFLWGRVKGPVNQVLKDEPKSEKEPLHIKITAKQFQFEFTYPGADGKLGTDDDYTDKDEMHVPYGRKIIFHLESKGNAKTDPGVMHSFWVRELRLKQDAIPGRIISGWFEVDKKLVELDSNGKKDPKVNWGGDIISGEKIMSAFQGKVQAESLKNHIEDGKTDDSNFAIIADDLDVQEELKVDTASRKAGQALTKAKMLEIANRVLAEKKKAYDDVEKAGHGRVFMIACAEICGVGHTRMKGYLVVDSPEGFEAWNKHEIEEHKKSK